MKNGRLFLVGTLLLLIPMPSTSQDEVLSAIRCTPHKRFICSEEGCEAVEPSGFVLLRKGEGEGGSSYARCDDEGCDIYPAKRTVSGAFENWQPENRSGTFLKRSWFESDIAGLRRNQYVEVATMWLSAHVSFGTCE